ncbi:methyl-accepting chemotaxis protein [Pseudoalteromonas peptidolytica]|uniref:methyl-accepting chemotaxis protein n=1 Tax=Pseudoalteromonas peptidolytica TaxID=61150 RepID=UPI00298EC117|nr:methyl-accepting chemotaxis protein [Pseudoalteromonas peptidolytica]MDW7550563.1 methyl-accepting chemotaxis protein [Pseudoalteromonas peptidolytica]
MAVKFKHKVVSVSAFVLLFALLVLSAIQYLSVRAAIKTQTAQSINEIIQGIGNTVTAQMKGATDLAALTTNLVAATDTLEGAFPILSQPQLTDAFLLIGYGEEQTGRYVASDPGWNPGANWDPRKRPWYTDAKNARELIITSPYADAVSNEIVVSIGAPVFKQGQFSGAIFYDVSLAKLGEMINSFNLLDAGYAFMVSKDGSTISHPDVNLNGKPSTEFLGQIKPSESLQYVKVDGEDKLVLFKEVTDLDWYLGVMLDENAVFAALSQLRRNAAVFAFISVVLATLLLSLVISWLLRPLDEINTAMAAIAKGNADLTVRLNTNHEPEFSALATNFNAFTNTLRTLIVNIQRSGHEVLSDAQHTSHVAAQSRQAIETQLETIKVLNNATTHMSATEHQVTKCAQEAAQAIKDTDQVAIQGEAIVAETTNTIGALSNQISSAMNVVTELESSSTAIEQILSVINSIAEQTNLLALNAAIEAARAGESGRGFAVVADEVRSLAQRTQEATTEIRGMINQLQSGSENAVTVMKQSQDYVEKTVDKAEQTRHALEDMRSAIRHIVELNSRIADMLHEQNDIVSNVNNSSASIKEISESVYNEARSVDSTMQSQVDKITGQEQLLEQFKV